MMTSTQPIVETPVVAAPRVRPAARELAVRIARLCEDMKCKDIAILDLGDRSPVAAYFVIASGSGSRQLYATAEEIKHRFVDDYGLRPAGIEGTETCKWVLMDYGETVVHLFDGPSRAYYDLEMLWGDAPRLEWKPQP